MGKPIAKARSGGKPNISKPETKNETRPMVTPKNGNNKACFDKVVPDFSAPSLCHLVTTVFRVPASAAPDVTAANNPNASKKYGGWVGK